MPSRVCSLRPSDAYICVNKLIIIGSNNGVSPGRCLAIVWTNVGILLIGPLPTNSSEILVKIDAFSFKNMHLKISFGSWRPFCLSFKWCCGTMACLWARHALFVSYSMPLVNTPQKRCIIDFDYSCPFPATVVVKQSPFFPIHVCCSANVNRKNRDCLRLQFVIFFSFE